MSIDDDKPTPPAGVHPYLGRDDDLPSEQPTPPDSPKAKAKSIRNLPPLPTGPDEVKTKVDLTVTPPGATHPSFNVTAKPETMEPRDSQPPPPVAAARPGFPGVTGDTQPGVASTGYVQRKVGEVAEDAQRQLRPAKIAIGGVSLLAVAQLISLAINTYDDHEDRVAQRQIQFENAKIQLDNASRLKRLEEKTGVAKP